MRLRTLTLLAALVFVLASPLLAAEEPQASYQKPATDEMQPRLQQEYPANTTTQPPETTTTTTTTTTPEPMTTEDPVTNDNHASATTTTTATTPEDEGLPKTASPLALLALLGLGGAGSAYGLRKARQR